MFPGFKHLFHPQWQLPFFDDFGKMRLNIVVGLDDFECNEADFWSKAITELQRRIRHAIIHKKHKRRNQSALCVVLWLRNTLKKRTSTVPTQLQHLGHLEFWINIHLNNKEKNDSMKIICPFWVRCNKKWIICYKAYNSSVCCNSCPPKKIQQRWPSSNICSTTWNWSSV